jgi:zinc protease
MYRAILFVFGVILLHGCASDHWRAKTVQSASDENSKVFHVNSYSFGKDLKAEKFRLANGLQIIILEDHSAPVFAYHTWFNVGSRNERDGITGIAHLFEHLMFKETKNQKEGSFDRILEEQGGRINAATYMDWTFYRESCPSAAFSLIPPLEADRLQNMILNDKQVNAEREVVANERRSRTDNNPSGKMYETLYMNAFTQHPYHWPVIGWMKDIQSISTKECIDFHSTYYAPNNATVIVVGDVKTDRVLKEIRQAYEHIPPSTIPEENIPKEAKQTKEKRAKIEQPIPGEKVLISFHIPDLLHKDYPILQVMSTLLFDGRSARLYRKLVTDLQIATEAGAWVNQTRDPGLFIIDISMRAKKKASEAEKIVYEEIEKLAEHMVSEDELTKAKNRLETSFWQNFRTADEKAQGLGFYETSAKDYRRLFDEVPSFLRVTPADIREVARQYFSADNRTVVVAKPKRVKD